MCIRIKKFYHYMMCSPICVFYIHIFEIYNLKFCFNTIHGHIILKGNPYFLAIN